MSSDAIDAITDLCGGDTSKALQMLLDGPTARSILQPVWRRVMSHRPVRIMIDDEESMLEEPVVYYKHPSFDLSAPIRVRFNNQPAIDTGGVTRQFFTDVLSKVARDDPFQLFVGESTRLRPAYSPQILSLMNIMGMIISHSLVLEGPGFPFLAPYVYWYIATGCEQSALPHVSVEHDLSVVATDVIGKVKAGYYL